MVGPYTGVPDGTGGTTAGCGVVAKSRDVGNNGQFQEAYGTFENSNKEGAMYGSYEDLRTRIVWYRDGANRNLTPEQEEFLSEET